MPAEENQPGLSGAITRFFVQHRLVGLITMVAVLAWGWFSAQSLPQQEDPTFPTHDAILVTECPGLNVEDMEKSVTAELERTISTLPSVENLASRTRAGVSIIVITLKPAKKPDIDRQWDQVRAALKGTPLPATCEPPALDTEYQLPATLLFSVTSTSGLNGSEPSLSPRTINGAAQTLAKELRKLPGVGRVRFTGEKSPERVLSPFPGAMSKMHITLDALKGALLAQDGSPRIFASEDDLLEVPVRTAGQVAVPLAELASLAGESTHQGEIVETLYHDQDGLLRSSDSVLLSVEMRRGADIHEFNEEVRTSMGHLRPSLPSGVDVITLSDQPAATARRIDQFLRCFGEAIVVVVLVTLLLMDWRTALVVAAAIPLTLAMTLGGMALLGVPLQQISVAALIISLGMLVDDPVVAADGINRELAAGSPRGVAAWLGPFKLRRAIFFGTLINIAAFLPLALLPGDMGAFIISLPVVITLALVSSRIVSMTFVPWLGQAILRGQRGFEHGASVRPFFLLTPVDKVLARLLPRYRELLLRVLKHPTRTIVIAYGLLILSCGLAPFFGKQFFPAAERSQMLVDIELPEGSPTGQTREVCRKVSAALAQEDAVTTAAISIGGGLPMFYYNVLPREPGTNVAQILINTRQAEDVPTLLVKLRARLDGEITNAHCIVKQLQQGPAMESPIQVQLTGDDLKALRATADEVRRLLVEAGAYHVHDDFGPRIAMPAITMHKDADTHGITASAIARDAFAIRRGIRVAGIQEEGRTTPVVMRLPETAQKDPAAWRDIMVQGAEGPALPFHEVASVSMQEDYPVISHVNQQRTITVKAFAPFGELASRALARAKPAIARIALPGGMHIAYAGEERELKNSQREMGRVMAISLLLIAAIMLIQFRSFTKSLVVMLTVPLGLIGAFIGLAAVHASFGFIALLGIVSLAGVIVSHIIVLSDFIEEARADGMPLEQALLQAGLVRLRAVLATVFATVCGLVPLAISGGQLWQPLTSVHIFGLLFATLLTLVLLPVLYYLFCARLRWIK